MRHGVPELPDDQQMVACCCGVLQVMQAAVYEFVLMYTSTIPATLKMSVGTFAEIMDGSAASIVTVLPPQVRITHCSYTPPAMLTHLNRTKQSSLVVSVVPYTAVHLGTWTYHAEVYRQRGGNRDEGSPP